MRCLVSVPIHTIVLFFSWAAAAQSSIDVRVSSNANDAEERSSGRVDLNSGDLEMILDGSRQQSVGVRFSPVNIPQGALITDAYIQFTVDETTSGSTVLVIQAQDADHAPAFGSGTNDISDRLRNQRQCWLEPATVDRGERRWERPAHA